MVKDDVPESGERTLCFVRTVKNRCRLCFTCVRRCPAKAIRIKQRQAEVVPERCIGCGNCVRVCSQGAKEVVPTIAAVEELLRGGARVAAMIAPSFPAEFQAEVDFRQLVGMVRALGFSLVAEVAFGADLVAERYRQLLVQNNGRRHVATTCPAVVGYVERYHPELVEHLAPIVSPMIAEARVLRQVHGADLRVVFIGPCVGKKMESADDDVAGEIDAVITYPELRSLFHARRIRADRVVPSDFDPPHPALGALFALSRGILQAAGVREDLLRGEVVAAEGVPSLLGAIGAFADGTLETGLLELLSCEGCIAGAGVTSTESLFKRRARVSHYVNYRMGGYDPLQWHKDLDRLAGLDLSRRFHARDQRLQEVPQREIRRILTRMGKKTRNDELNCGACGYQTCREHAIAIKKGLAESEMCLPYVIEEFQRTIHELQLSSEKLASTQEQLMHSERLASMGQLAAGVAHELNNPLGVILMYAHLMADDLPEEAEEREDLRTIVAQADRCRRIVAGLLDFARENKALLQAVDVGDLIAQGVNGVPAPASVRVRTELGHTTRLWDLDPDQMVQVLTNLISNAYAAMPDGGLLTVRTAETQDRLTIEVRDTGCGIPKANAAKIFQPFFTTKKLGKGAGLGLAVTYGIVKMHRGDVTVASNADPAAGPTGTTFTVTLPARAPQEPASIGGERIDKEI
jgi:two-component system NtrC family sensor kinase